MKESVLVSDQKSRNFKANVETAHWFIWSVSHSIEVRLFLQWLRLNREPRSCLGQTCGWAFACCSLLSHRRPVLYYFFLGVGQESHCHAAFPWFSTSPFLNSSIHSPHCCWNVFYNIQIFSSHFSIWSSSIASHCLQDKLKLSSLTDIQCLSCAAAITFKLQTLMYNSATCFISISQFDFPIYGAQSIWQTT